MIQFLQLWIKVVFSMGEDFKILGVLTIIYNFY